MTSGYLTALFLKRIFEKNQKIRVIGMQSLCQEIKNQDFEVIGG